MIIDTHVHLLPERLAAKIRRFFVDRNAPAMVYPYQASEARERLLKAGIQLCWSLPYAHRIGVAAPLNRWMAETFAGDSFVVPGGTVHPEDDVGQVVREAIQDLGLRVFKLHCSVGAFSPDDPRLDPLWEAVSQTGHPVVVHAGRAPDGTATPDDVAAIGRTAARWPKARIILAHFGFPALAESLDLLRGSQNVWADLCPVVSDPVVLTRESLAGLERRILFGSDAPTVAVLVEDSIARVRAWRLNPADEEAVLGGNAAALLAAVEPSGFSPKLE